MKLESAALLLAGAATGVTASSLHSHSTQSNSVDTVAQLVTGGKIAVTPQDLEKCVKYMDDVLPRPEAKGRAIEAATDHCALEHKEDDRNYVCVDFKETLINAFSEEHEAKEFSSRAFCEITEAYVLSIRGASRMENVGSGALFSFKISSKCEPMVAAHFDKKGATSVDAPEVPDLWYGICMNQDCGHYLPSRTRWCQFQTQPTHSVEVCEALLKFTTDVTEKTSGDYNAKQVCALYGDFVTSMGHDVEAYEHVVHGDTKHRVPKPGDKARALQSSQLVNDAGGHNIRDSSGDPIKRNGAARVGSAWLSAVAALATAAFAA